MARDYRPKAKRHGFSGGLGVAFGLALGLSLAGVVYFKDRHAVAPALLSTKTAGKAKARVEPPDADADSGAPDEPAKSYDFYSMLPKFEVVVPEKDKDVKPDVRGVPETRRGTYVLQAGSYKNFADADRIRIALLDKGIILEDKPGGQTEWRRA